MPTYRTAGAWGAGSGVNLTPAQVDNNFYELRTDLDDVIANPPTADSVVSVSQDGFYLTFHTTLGNDLGPIAVPVVYTVWRGDWAPFTLYSAADLFRDPTTGIYAVNQDHTSAATFDPDAAAGSPLAPLYLQLIGVASLDADTSLEDLNDVTITSVAVSDFIVWTGTEWANQTTTVVRGLLAVPDVLDDLDDVDAPTPSLGQVLTWAGSPASWRPAAASTVAALDDLTDVTVPSPTNGQVLTYQAGSPTGWIAASPASVPTTLDALTDVIVPSPTDGDLLQFDGADWINAAGVSLSGLADAFLPLIPADYIEISQSSGSPPGSPPVGYESRKATIANILSAGGFTLGSTSIALGGTTATVASLTLSGGTLSATTTLPGSGQISAAGELSLGGAPAALVTLAGNYTTAGANVLLSTVNIVSSLTTQIFAIDFSNTISPAGASLTNAQNMRSSLVVDNTAVTVSNAVGFTGTVSLGASFSGVVTNGIGNQVINATVSGSGRFTNFRQYNAATLTVNDGLTSGTSTLRNMLLQGITSSAAGGTINSRGLEVTLPSGNATSGTNNNRGIYIAGNGGTAAGGTVNNFAIFSDSTAASQFAGALQATELQQVGANGGLTTVKSLSELTTIAAAAFTDTSIQIPAGALVVGVSVRSNVAIPTAVTYDVGVSGATTRYATAVSDVVGTTSPGTADGVRYYSTATSIRITPDATPASNTGRVRVSIRYIEVTPPTS